MTPHFAAALVWARAHQVMAKTDVKVPAQAYMQLSSYTAKHTSLRGI